MAGGAEVLIAKACLRNSGIQDGVEHTEDSLHMTILVSLDATEAQRRTARTLASSFIAASCEFMPPPTDSEFGARLAQVVDTHEDAHLNITIALPDFSPTVRFQLEEFLTAIRASRHHQIGLVVGVASSPRDWAGCTGFDGFVEATPNRRINDALHVFKLLSTLMAPGVLMSCFDTEDFREALWPAMDVAPARVIEAVWFSRDDRLAFSASADRDFIFGSQSLVLLWPCRTGTRLRDVNGLLTQIKTQTSEEMSVIYATPYGLTADPEVSADVMMVTILSCR